MSEKKERWLKMINRIDECLKTAEVKDKALCEKTTEFLTYLNGNKSPEKNKYGYAIYTMHVFDFNK